MQSTKKKVLLTKKARKVSKEPMKTIASGGAPTVKIPESLYKK